MRIAMWSGPRNLSTAMMYSFAQRSDCEVVDEPFYAAYLADTGLDHPMRAEILANQPNNVRDVVADLAGAPKYCRYEKHMTHHMLPDWPMDWLADVINVFLIRHPARVIASYSAKRENPTADDLGFRRQHEILRNVVDLGQTPIVIDSADIRNDPRSMLVKLCTAIDLPFQAEMLTWPLGPNPADGVWAAHWYSAVHNSSGFAGTEGTLPDVEAAQADLLAETLGFYDALVSFKL